MRNPRFLCLAAVLGCILALSGCVNFVPSPVGVGSCYTEVRGPHEESITMHVGGSKMGSSSATNVLGWVATGDASINAAAKSAGITKINYVDYHTTSILLLYVTYETVVYGE